MTVPRAGFFAFQERTCLMRIIPRMSTIESSVSSILLDRVAEWLTNSSLAGDDLENIVRGFCERIAAAGLPLARVHLSFSMLASALRCPGLHLAAGERRHDRGLSPFHRAQSPTAFYRAPITICSTTICSISAAASRMMARLNSRSSRICAREDHRLPCLRAALRRRFRAGHDGLLVDGQSFRFL